MAQQAVDVNDLPGPGQFLVFAFLAMEPLDFLLPLARDCGGGSITEEVQRFIWNQCISKASERSHAPYLRNFLKKVIAEVESSGDEVLEEIYEQFAYYMSSMKDVIPGEGNSRILKYISFLSRDGASRLVVPLQCSLNMLDGDTGCSLWPSSFSLSEFILSYPEFFTNKSCFEVGSGVGLVGICLGHVKASKVVMSDGDLSSLANLKVNLKMNQMQESDTVKCIYLPWESAKQSVLQEFMPDIVLGADVIYDPSCIPHLVRVLFSLLQRGKTRHHQRQSNIISIDEASHVDGHERHGRRTAAPADEPELEIADAESLSRELESGPVAFIACVVRNFSTFKLFIDLAGQATLKVRNLTATVRPAKLLPYLQSYLRSDVKLLLVSPQQ
ncbi:hypothetical protein Dimus_021732 [Dionaea muscipula]